MISFLFIVIVLVVASIYCFIKTLKRRKTARLDAEAAAAYANTGAQESSNPYKPTEADLEQMSRATRVFSVTNVSERADMPPPTYEEAIVILQVATNQPVVRVAARY